MLTFNVGQAVFVPRPEAPVFFTGQIRDLAPRKSILTKRIPHALSGTIHQPSPHVGATIGMEPLDFVAGLTCRGAVDLLC